jgi:hypothetical protein
LRTTWLRFVTAVLALGALVCWVREEGAHRTAFIAFGELGRGCLIVVPTDATDSELEGAKLVAETLAAAANRHVNRFPIRREGFASRFCRAIYVGQTRRGSLSLPLGGASPLDRPVAFSICADAVTIRASERDDSVIAASVFLEEVLGARWFAPGNGGVEVERRRFLRLYPRAHVATGRYYSRELGGTARSPEGRAWAGANRLHSLLPGGHTASELVSVQLMARRPQFAPVLNGTRFMPEPKAVVNWQPDLLAPELAAEVAAELGKKFHANPDALGFAFGLNDTYRFDQSSRTLDFVRPEKFFRGRPDYSDLLFSFLNEVANDLKPQFPNRFVTTYAYDWTENTPRFRVKENIMPFLTADRSMWFDARFAAEDRALIERWGKAGPKFFGLYDYYYGAPFLVPRPTLWAVTEAIPYAYEKGARAFYAEATPNWALDGPKPWLAAQLLWNPKGDSAKLLDEYYSRFWKEAAAPMRAFYELCDKQWREQPLPPVWVKYLKDDDQRRLFPPAVRDRLRRYLDEANVVAQAKAVRERVQFVAEAFAVTEAFCRHDEVREELQRLAFEPQTPSDDLRCATLRYTAARESFIRQFRDLRKKSPLAIQTSSIDEYLRCDPRGRVVDALARRNELSFLSPTMLTAMFDGRIPTATALQGAGRELLDDPGFRTLSIKQVHPFTLTDWVERGPWGGKTEPTEHRKIDLFRDSDGTQRVRYSGCNQETLWQWRQAKPGHLYRATVWVKGYVNPGTMVYLLIPFTDKNGQHIGAGHIDRLPTGDWPGGVQLEVLVRAPANATNVAASLRTLYQVPSDWTEWEQLSLRDMGP